MKSTQRSKLEKLSILCISFLNLYPIYAAVCNQGTDITTIRESPENTDFNFLVTPNIIWLCHQSAPVYKNLYWRAGAFGKVFAGSNRSLR